MPQYFSQSLSFKKTTWIGIILGVIVFMRTMPCYLWSVEDIVRPICAIIVLIICLFNISKEKWTYWILLCLTSAYTWAVLFVDHSSFITLFNFLAFAFIPTLKKETVYDTYKVFRALIVFFIACSIINFIFLKLGWVYDGRVIEPLNTLKLYKYIMYPFLVTSMGESSGRFQGIWDEPGMIGNICGLLLIAERMNLKKKMNWVLLVGGFLSLSFFFYVAFFLGIVLFSSKLKHRFASIIIIFVAFMALYNNSFLYNTLWYRFEWNAAEGRFVGDNRNGYGLNDHYESIQGTSAFFTGEGSVAASEYSGAASLYLIIVKHGFIFVVLNLLGYGILSWREIKNKREWILFFLFFVATLYQRPGFYNTSSIFLYTMLIYEFGAVEVVFENKRKELKQRKNYKGIGYAK